MVNQLMNILPKQKKLIINKLSLKKLKFALNFFRITVKSFLTQPFYNKMKYYDSEEKAIFFYIADLFFNALPTIAINGIK